MQNFLCQFLYHFDTSVSVTPNCAVFLLPERAEQHFLGRKSFIYEHEINEIEPAHEIMVLIT